MIREFKIDKLKEWFNQYVKPFYNNKEDLKEIDLKYQHSYRVYHNICELAQKLKLSNDEQIIASIIGLLHDLARFEQYKRYKTFDDSKSLDHGNLAVEIIKENKLLQKINPPYQKIIYQAIQYHNKLNLPPNLDNKTLLFARLIRDADKLDIWNIFAKRYSDTENNDKINLELSTAPRITVEIYQKILNGQPVKYSNLKTVNDFKLIQLGWVYDLNFRESLLLLKKRNYLSKIYNSMDQLKQVKKIYQNINNYIDEKTADLSK